MKNIEQIREQVDLILEAEAAEERKLVSLIRAGLLDVKKLPALKRALSRDNKVMTPGEREALLKLLDSLMSEVLHNNQVYNKVKQNVMKEELRPVTTRMSDMPSILVLKRKAIRVYPGGQNVGLYYSQQLDRYVAVPFGERDRADGKSVLSMTEEMQLDEISNAKRFDTYAKRLAAASLSDDDEDREINRFKATKTMIQTMSTKGPVTALKMQKHARKMAKEIHPHQVDFDDEDDVKPDKRYKFKKKDRGQEWNRLDRNARGTGSFKGDLVANISSNHPHPIAKAIGSYFYRKRRPTTPPMPDHFKITEARAYGKLDGAMDAASFTPGPIGTAASIGSAVLSATRGDWGGAALDLAGAIPVAGYGAKAAKVAKVAKGVSTVAKTGKGLSKGTRLARGLAKARRLARLGRRLDFDRDDNNNGSGAAAPSGPSMDRSKYSKEVGYGKESNLKINASNSFRLERDRQASKQMAYNPNIRESVEVDLDGNLFEINSSVANKLVSVYQSLNEQNRQKMVDKMNESTESFNKVISFVVRH